MARAFNQLPHASLVSEAHRAGEKIGTPLAADDKAALGIAVQLVKDAKIRKGKRSPKTGERLKAEAESKDRQVSPYLLLPWTFWFGLIFRST